MRQISPLDCMGDIRVLGHCLMHRPAIQAVGRFYAYSNVIIQHDYFVIYTVNQEGGMSF